MTWSGPRRTPHRKVGRRVLGCLGQIGCNLNDFAFDFGRRTQVEGRKPDLRHLAQIDLIDILRPHMGVYDEFVEFGHDRHHIGARCNHPADSMDRKLMHNPGARSPHLHALQFCLCGTTPFQRFGDTRFGLAQVAQGAGAGIVIKLDDLEPGFADPALGRGDPRHKFALLAFEPRTLAIERKNPVRLDETLLQQLFEVFQFLADQDRLFFFGGVLRLKPLNFLLELTNPLAELLDAACQCRSLYGKKLPLAGDSGRRCADRSFVFPGSPEN